MRFFDLRREVGGGGGGAAFVGRRDDHAQRVADIGGGERVCIGGGAGDVQAVAARPVALLPLVFVAGGAVFPGAVGRCEGVAFGVGAADRGRRRRDRRRRRFFFGFFDRCRGGRGGGGGAAFVDRGDDHAHRVFDVGGGELVRVGGGAGDVGATVAGGIAVLPLVFVAGGAVFPGAVGGGEGVAHGIGAADRGRRLRHWYDTHRRNGHQRRAGAGREDERGQWTGGRRGFGLGAAQLAPVAGGAAARRPAQAVAAGRRRPRGAAPLGRPARAVSPSLAPGGGGRRPPVGASSGGRRRSLGLLGTARPSAGREQRAHQQHADDHHQAVRQGPPWPGGPPCRRRLRVCDHPAQRYITLPSGVEAMLSRRIWHGVHPRSIHRARSLIGVPDAGHERRRASCSDASPAARGGDGPHRETEGPACLAIGAHPVYWAAPASGGLGRVWPLMSVAG